MTLKRPRTREIAENLEFTISENKGLQKFRTYQKLIYNNLDHRQPILPVALYGGFCDNTDGIEG